jgi:hypothetical protein
MNVKSSYEERAIHLLDGNPDVRSFEYEPTIRVGSRWIYPDFLVEWTDGRRTLIEVKASWALTDPASCRRLDLARTVAQQRGWEFAIYTEENLGIAPDRR